MEKYNSLAEIDDALANVGSQLGMINAAIDVANEVDKRSWQSKKATLEREREKLSALKRDFNAPKIIEQPKTSEQPKTDAKKNSEALEDETGVVLGLMLEQIDVLQNQKNESDVADMEKQLDMLLSPKIEVVKPRVEANKGESVESLENMLEMFITNNTQKEVAKQQENTKKEQENIKIENVQKENVAFNKRDEIKAMDSMLDLFLAMPEAEKHAEVAVLACETEGKKEVSPESVENIEEKARAQEQLQSALDRAEKLDGEVEQIKRAQEAERAKHAAEMEAERAKHAAETDRIRQQVALQREAEQKEAIKPAVAKQEAAKIEVIAESVKAETPKPEVVKEDLGLTAAQREYDNSRQRFMAQEANAREDAARIAQKIAQRKVEITQLRNGLAAVKDSDSAFILREKFFSLQLTLDEEERRNPELTYLIVKSMDDISHALEVAVLKRKLAIAANKIEEGKMAKKREAQYRPVPRNPLRRHVRSPRDDNNYYR